MKNYKCKEETKTAQSIQQVDVLELPLFPVDNQNNRNHFQCNYPCGTLLFQNTDNDYMSEKTIKVHEYFLVARIQSKLHNKFKLTAIMPDSNLTTSFKRCFGSLKIFADFLSANLGRFQFTIFGFLSYYVPSQLFLYLNSKRRLQIQRQFLSPRQIPNHCLGYIYTRMKCAGRGFLLNQNVVMTLASCLYDRQKKRQRPNVSFISPAGEKIECSEFIYPQQYQNCPADEIWKYNYGLVSLGGVQMFMENEVPLIYNFDESQLLKELEKQKKSKNMNKEYFINGIPYAFNQIETKKGQLQNINHNIDQGSPIWISLGERSVIIGMKTDTTKCLLFDDTHPMLIFQWMHKLKISKQYILNTNIFPAHVFYSNYQQIGINKQKRELLLPIDNQNKMAQLEQQWMNSGEFNKLIALLEAKASKRYLIPEEKIKIYRKALNIYNNAFKQTHWKMSKMLFSLGQAYMDNCEYPSAIPIFEKAIKHQKLYGSSNPTFLVQLHFVLAQACQINSNEQSAISYYDEASTISQKIHHSYILASCLKRKALIQKQKGKISLSLKYFFKAVEILRKNDHKKEAVLSLFCCAETAIQNDKLKQGQTAMIELLKQLKSTGFDTRQEKKRIYRLWKLYCSRIYSCEDSSFKEAGKRVAELYMQLES